MDDEHALIAGYYCISAGEVSRDAAPPPLARRAPNPLPVVRMGRFAVDRRYQGQGWGSDLLREALRGAAAAVELIGGRAMLVDAISDDAKQFYEHFGFQTSPIHPMQLMYDLRIVIASACLDTGPPHQPPWSS
jgi:GNAT superfamily N-acetyltransferase